MKPQLLPADRIGLSRLEASAYINVSPSTFDALVRNGDMPKPKHIGTRRIWSRRDVELAFERIESVDGPGGPGDKRADSGQDALDTPPWEDRAA